MTTKSSAREMMKVLGKRKVRTRKQNTTKSVTSENFTNNSVETENHTFQRNKTKLSSTANSLTSFNLANV